MTGNAMAIRIWQLAVAVGAFMLCLGAQTWAESEASSLDVQAWEQVGQIRQKLHLRNEDLGAMGCSQESAETVLRALVAWYRSNSEEFQAEKPAQAKPLPIVKTKKGLE